MSNQSLAVRDVDEQNPKQIIERVRRPGDPLQEMARSGAPFDSTPNLRQRWFRAAPELRLAVACLVLAPLLLACIAVAAMVTR